MRWKLLNCTCWFFFVVVVVVVIFESLFYIVFIVSYYRFHLARCCRQRIYAAAATIVLAQRKAGDMLPFERLKVLEREAGEAILTAVARFTPLATA